MVVEKEDDRLTTVADAYSWAAEVEPATLITAPEHQDQMEEEWYLFSPKEMLQAQERYMRMEMPQLHLLRMTEQAVVVVAVQLSYKITPAQQAASALKQKVVMEEVRTSPGMKQKEQAAAVEADM